MSWIEGVCQIPLRLKKGESSIRGLFWAAEVPLFDRSAFESNVRAFLETRPELIEAWATYSADKRTSAGPYFELALADSVVGFFEHGRLSERHFADRAAGCAAFVYEEAVWVIEQRRG